MTLNRTGSDLAGAIRSPRRRLSATVAACAASMLAFGCDRSEPLVTVDSEREANRILNRLPEGIDAVKESRSEQRRTVWMVSVPATQIVPAREALEQLGLPRERPRGLEATLAGAGLIPSRSDERLRLMQAVAGELTMTLEAIPGVAEARVHVVLPERDPLAGPAGTAGAPPATASVLIVYEGDGADGAAIPQQLATLDERPAVGASGKTAGETKVTALQAMVAAAVEGLAPEHVSVALVRSEAKPKIEVKLTSEGGDMESFKRAQFWSRARLAAGFGAAGLLAGIVVVGLCSSKKIRTKLRNAFKAFREPAAT